MPAADAERRRLTGTRIADAVNGTDPAGILKVSRAALFGGPLGYRRAPSRASISESASGLM